MFFTFSHFRPSLIFLSEARSNVAGVAQLGETLTLPTIIRLGCKGLIMSNTVAYYITKLIPVVKSFVVQALVLVNLPVHVG